MTSLLAQLGRALYNYLLAKATGGQFILRVEDTDRRRTVPGAQERLCEDLKWAGLQWDEGPIVDGPYGPYNQSARISLYKQHADLLVKSGHGYRCFCSPERLLNLAKDRAQRGVQADYDRACAHIPFSEAEERASLGEAHVIRLKAPNDWPSFDDLVYGTVRSKPKGTASRHTGEPAFEDPILLKTDGMPTYHLANVVDDHEMKITHVVRASEWMSSTPKHMALYRAFNWAPPAFVHVGLLQNEDGAKLSKRNFDSDLSFFRDTLEILPSALLNFAALLGWSHSRRSDVMDLKELVENFSMKFTKGNTVVTDYKLWYLQKAHAQRLLEGPSGESSIIEENVYRRLHDSSSKYPQLPSILDGRNLREYIRKAFLTDAKNYRNSSSFIKDHLYMFDRPQSSVYTISEEAVVTEKVTIQHLDEALNTLPAITVDDWTSNNIKEQFSSLTKAPSNDQDSSLEEGLRKRASKVWTKEVYGYLRHVIAAGQHGPAIADVMALLGRRECLTRLARQKELSSG